MHTECLVYSLTRAPEEKMGIMHSLLPGIEQLTLRDKQLLCHSENWAARLYS